MAGEVALYDGHAVAAVAATSALLAQDAARLIEVDVRGAAACHRRRCGDGARAPRRSAPGAADYSVPEGMHAQRGAATSEFGRGDLEAGFAAADLVRERTYKTEATHQGYIEPHACVGQLGEDGTRRDVGLTTQGHWYVRRMCADVLGLEVAQPAGDAVRDRRRLRRQDDGVHGAAGAGAVAQGGRASRSSW